MLRFRTDKVKGLKLKHATSVVDYVKSLPDSVQDRLFADILQLSGFEGSTSPRDREDYGWLMRFILADMGMLRSWVWTQPEKLQFPEFSELYEKGFANGADHFVDRAGTFNAYVLIEEQDVHVCPYCDDEYLDVVTEGGKKKRTSEVDHFFPKGKYPGLAMCFYNLIVSGQNCNGLKLQNLLGASPYDEDIEEQTFLFPEIEIGVNMESLKPEECKVLLHAKRGMVENEKVLGLADRYAGRYQEAYNLLLRKQQFPEEKIEELVSMRLFATKEEALAVLFGRPSSEAKFSIIHQKMKKDLIGY